MSGTGKFAGVPVVTLSQWLTDAQTARHELLTGRRTQMVSYGQGDGTKTVTYTRANMADLDAHITDLLTALGTSGVRRRAVGVVFT